MATSSIPLQPPIRDHFFANPDPAQQIISQTWAEFFERMSKNASQPGAAGPPGPPGSSGTAGNVQVSYNGQFYLNSIQRALNDKAGERISVLDFGAIADSGVTDNAPLFALAYAAAVAKGGCEIYAPGAPGGSYYGFATSLALTSTVPVIFSGDGRASKIQRTGTMPSQTGVFDLVGAKNIKFRGLMIDGAVTTPVGVNYSTFAYVVLADVLSLNSSFWLHDGCAFIEFEDVVITHTGGYAIVAHADLTDITDLHFDHVTLENNRPHLFGTNNGSLIYGSWTGGILLHGNGLTTDAMIRRAQFVSCTAFRCTGNCFWQTLLGFSSLHEDIYFTDCHGEDCGLDWILIGGVTNWGIFGGSFRRIGYTTVDDSSASVPRWNNGAGIGVAIDHSGVAINGAIVGVTGLSCNGGYIDADGMSQTSVTNCVFRTPRSTDPEYATDLIATTGWAGSVSPGGPNYCYGLQTGNTSGIVHTEINTDGNLISGCKFTNLSGGAVRLYGTQNSQCVGCDIDHPASPTAPPITVGGITSAVNERGTDNVINNNRIFWDPSSATPIAVNAVANTGGTAACIVEDATLVAFQSGDKNWVFGNIIISPTHGLAYEFKRNTNTASSTGLNFSSNFAALSTPSFSAFQREGRGADSTSALKVYNIEGVTVHTLAQFQQYRGAAVVDSLLNISLDGGAQTGVLTTGALATAPFGNAVVTGKLYGSGFLALTDTTYLDADADLLPNTVSLLKWDNGLTRWRQSISTSAGARVWSDFTAGGAAGADTNIQYNKAASFGADANLTWDYTGQHLVLHGVTGGGAYAAFKVTDPNSPHTAYIQSDGGFYTPIASASAINVPAGGITALTGVFGGIPNQAVAAALIVGPPTGSVGSPPSKRCTLLLGDNSPFGWAIGIDGNANGTEDLFFYQQSTAKVWASFSTAGNLAVFGVVNGSNTASGANITFQNNNSKFSVNANGTISSADVVSAAVGFNVTGNPAQSNCIQAVFGGVAARSAGFSKYTQVGQSGGVPAVTTGDTLIDGCLYYDTGSTTLKARIAGSFVDVITSATVAGVSSLNTLTGALTIAAAANTVAVVSATGTTITLGFASTIIVAGVASAASVTATAGYMQSADGYYTTSAATNAIKVPNGGVTALTAALGGYPNQAVLAALVIAPPTGSVGGSIRSSILLGTNSVGWVIGTDGSADGTEDLFFYQQSSAKAWASFSSAGNLSVFGVISGANIGSGLNTTFQNSNSKFSVNANGTISSADVINAVVGFNVTGNPAQSNSIQSINGGVACRSANFQVYTQVGRSAGAPTLTTGDTLLDGCIYYDTNILGFRGRINGAFVTFAAGSGVSSLNALTGALNIVGTANEVIVTPSGTSVTLSLPQQIDVNAAVHFNSILCNNAGSGITFGNANATFQVTGNGAITTSGFVNITGIFHTTNSTFQSFQSDSGGISARSAHFNVYTQVGQSFGNPSATSGDAIANGCLYFDTQFNVLSTRTPSGFQAVLTQGGALVNTAGAWVGVGVDVGRFQNVAGRAFNPYTAAGVLQFGKDYTIGFNGTKLTVNGAAVNTITVTGGSVVNSA